MQTINIRQAKFHLSRLVDQAANGESFVIAKAGCPLVKVTALDSATGDKARRTGFLSGHIQIPEDFDTMGSGEIEGLMSTATTHRY